MSRRNYRKKEPEFHPMYEKRALSGEDLACDIEGCTQDACYPAPKLKSRDYFWFCIDHVREYNKAWDYYRGMSDEEVQDAIKDDVTWQRPSWPMGAVFKDEDFILKTIKKEFMKGGSTSHTFYTETISYTQEQKQAFKVLNLEPTSDREIIKERYKLLVKTFHPDLHKGNKNFEEQLKKINQSYAILKKIS